MRSRNLAKNGAAHIAVAEIFPFYEIGCAESRIESDVGLYDAYVAAFVRHPL